MRGWSRKQTGRIIAAQAALYGQFLHTELSVNSFF